MSRGNISRADPRRVSRRSLLPWGLAAGAWLHSGRSHAGERPPRRFGLPPIGRLSAPTPRSIAASPLSVGFETLDRRHFDPKRTYPHLAELGAKWARCQTGWNRCERVRGRFEFGWLDEVVDSLLAIGVQPWFNLGYGNRLYTPEKPGDASVGWAPVFDSAAREAWLRFTRELAEHFRDRVRHWEIWNEPNIKQFWKPRPPNPRDYVALVAPTAAVIRRAAPDAVIIGGALAGIPIRYLEGCLKAGLAEHVDRISYHPYRPVPEAGYEAEIRAMRDLIANYKRTLRLWQGENGCPSRGGSGSVGALSNLAWDEQRQAKWLLRRILCDLRLEVELTSYFHLVDLVGYRGQTNFKGLLRGKDYTRKPAFYAYQCLAGLFDADTRRSTGLRLEPTSGQRPELIEAGFARRGRGLVAYWSPASLQQEFRPRQLAARLRTPPGATIQEPVLIDPMASRVFRLEAARAGTGCFSWNDLPLLDYPLILADRAIVEIGS